MSTPQSPLSSIFLNERGLRSGWRLMIYFVILVVLWIGAILLLEALRPQRGATSPWVLLVGESVSFCVAFGGARMMAAIEGRSVAAYGLPLEGAFGKLFWLGALVGFCEISLLMALIAAFGGYSFGSIALNGGQLVYTAVSWAIFFVVVGLLEEFLFRGYTQYTLTEGIGFWPAAVVLSASFSLVHLRNPGEGWVGAAGVFAIGLIFCFALKRTGNLWFCVGMHAAFDYGETFLYSVPNSGMVFEGHLSSATLHGPLWLTGGTAGPEGTVFSFVTMGLVALAIHVLFPAKPAEPSREIASAPAVQ
jgi:membrane protease YdiL (CAAX protease family)